MPRLKCTKVRRRVPKVKTCIIAWRNGESTNLWISAAESSSSSRTFAGGPLSSGWTLAQLGTARKGFYGGGS